MSAIPETRHFDWGNNFNIGLLARALKGRRWRYNYELVTAVGHRFGAALQELRKRGFVIDTRPVRARVWKYRWNGKFAKYRPSHHSCPSCTCFSRRKAR